VVIGRRVRSIETERRARRDLERSIPDAVELFVLLIHAGLTPVQAIRELTVVAPPPTRPGFAAVVHDLERGGVFSDALAALPQHLGSSTVGLADVVASADRNGAPLGPVLESLAQEARAARRRQHEADARRLPVRLSFPLVVCTLPSFVLLAIAPAVIAALSSISLSI
jgi:tight adherence protein C